MTKPRIPQQLRRLVGQRAEGFCEYCLCPESCATQRHSIEHIQPQSLGGLSLADNLALSCQGCNGAKYNKTHALDSLTRQLAPLFHPRQHLWNEQFAWTPDCLRLIGLTPTGRATIEELELNRAGVMRLRRLLLLDGEHPPRHRA